MSAFLFLTGSSVAGAAVVPPAPAVERLGGGGKVRREWIDLYTKTPKRRIPAVRGTLRIPIPVPALTITGTVVNPRPVMGSMQIPVPRFSMTLRGAVEARADVLAEDIADLELAFAMADDDDG